MNIGFDNLIKGFMLNKNINIPFQISYFNITVACLNITVACLNITIACSNITIACSTTKLDNLNFVVDGTPYGALIPMLSL